MAAALFLGTRNKQERRFADYRLFVVMLVVTMVELAADTTMWVCEGAADPVGWFLLRATTVIYYIGQPIASLAYAGYAIYQVNGDSRRAGRLLKLLSLPAAASMIVSLISPFAGLYFTFDASNVYHHGPLFLVFIAISYLYMGVAFVYVLIKRNSLERKSVQALLFFPLPPAIGGILQTANYGLVLIWPAVVLSLLVIYINIQQRKLATDYLTGAFNRRRLDVYLEGRVRDCVESKQGRPFAGFMADVDSFKGINDRYGHAAGDEALVATVELIRSCLRVDDFLARYAGDEFVALLPFSDEGQLAQVVERVNTRFAEHKSPASSPYALSLSIGAAVFDPETDADPDKYIARLDRLMYEAKRAKKTAQEMRR